MADWSHGKWTGLKPVVQVILVLLIIGMRPILTDRCGERVRTRSESVMDGPLYRQIADELRRKIESGALKEGERIPTEDQLMESYSASRNTVRDALKELRTRRLVDTLHGKGTFVRMRGSPIVTTLSSDPETGRGGGEGLVYTAEVAASGRSPSALDPRVEIIKAGPAIARILGIPERADVIVRHQERYVDDLAWSLQTSYYPMSLVERGATKLLQAADIEPGTVAYLRQVCDIRQDGYQDAIEWRAPNKVETDYFGLPADGRVQIVEIRRIAFDQNEKRVRLTITVYRADRNRFVINVGKVPRNAMH
jgi:GntR family transcriptional regulator